MEGLGLVSADGFRRRVLSWNNAVVAASVAPDLPNPRDATNVSWCRHLAERHPAIRAEWDRFVAAGGRLPHIDDVIAEDQGNQGAWRIGMLVHEGRVVEPFGLRFPETLDALGHVRGLRSALWSELDPGAVLPEHCGPNGGVLRYHLGVSCRDGSGLRVDGTTVPYRDGVGLLFDDTHPHEAWNAGDAPRVTLFCEVLRPLPLPAYLLNLAAQRVLEFDPRYRRIPGRAADWDAHLNGSLANRTASLVAA